MCGEQNSDSAMDVVLWRATQNFLMASHTHRVGEVRGSTEGILQMLAMHVCVCVCMCVCVCVGVCACLNASLLARPLNQSVSRANKGIPSSFWAFSLIQLMECVC